MKRAPLPTTRWVGPIERFDQREQQHSKAAVGTLGEKVQERWNSEPPDPFRRIYFPSYNGRAKNAPLRSWVPIADGPVNPNQTPVNDPAKMSAHIKEAAKFFGAHLVGICELKPEFIYTHRGLHMDYHKGRWGEPIELRHRFAIALGHEMAYHNLKFSPSFIDGAEVGKGYLISGLIAVQLACYIRELGWPAKAHFHMEEQVMHVPIAIQAGLGEQARNNCLITREFGPRLRLATVTTDLPLAVDSPIDIGVQEFCNTCNKCAKWCPSQAISYGPKQVQRGGLETWPVDNDKCIVYWNANRAKWNDCARCITVCPWNQPHVWYHKLAVKLAPTAIGRRLLLWIDELLAPGRKKVNPKGGWLHYTRSTDARKFPNGHIYPPT